MSTIVCSLFYFLQLFSTLVVLFRKYYFFVGNLENIQLSHFRLFLIFFQKQSEQ
jgi:hypothetical protein